MRMRANLLSLVVVAAGLVMVDGIARATEKPTTKRPGLGPRPAISPAFKSKNSPARIARSVDFHPLISAQAGEVDVSFGLPAYPEKIVSAKSKQSPATRPELQQKRQDGETSPAETAPELSQFFSFPGGLVEGAPEEKRPDSGASPADAAAEFFEFLSFPGGPKEGASEKTVDGEIDDVFNAPATNEGRIHVLTLPVPGAKQNAKPFFQGRPSQEDSSSRDSSIFPKLEPRKEAKDNDIASIFEAAKKLPIAHGAGDGSKLNISSKGEEVFDFFKTLAQNHKNPANGQEVGPHGGNWQLPPINFAGFNNLMEFLPHKKNWKINLPTGITVNVSGIILENTNLAIVQTWHKILNLVDLLLKRSNGNNVLLEQILAKYPAVKNIKIPSHTAIIEHTETGNKVVIVPSNNSFPCVLFDAPPQTISEAMTQMDAADGTTVTDVPVVKLDVGTTPLSAEQIIEFNSEGQHILQHACFMRNIYKAYPVADEDDDDATDAVTTGSKPEHVHVATLDAVYCLALTPQPLKIAGHDSGFPGGFPGGMGGFPGGFPGGLGGRPGPNQY